MSLVWAIVTGFILSYVFKSGWFFLLGLFIGPMLYRKYIGWMDKIHTNNVNPTLYLVVLFEALGHISKAKGVVTQDNIALATRLMDQLNLDSDKRKLAQESFNKGKSANYPLQERLQELYNHYRYRKKVLNVFCEQLIIAAVMDGVLDEKEQQVLFIVARIFHIPQTQMAMYIQMMMASQQFRQSGTYQGGYYQYEHYQQNSGYQQNSYQRRTSQNDIDNAYKILGVAPSSDPATIKRAYRKLMNEHHPDKLMSKGLPKEMLEAAKKRAQEIQAAYDAIKLHRGFK